MVLASDSGSTVQCGACRAAIEVPRLSDLRRSAGQGAFESSSIDVVNRMIRDGRIPIGANCLISGVPTFDYVDVELLCESPYLKKGGLSPALFMILGFWAVLVASSRPDDVQHGRETRITIPLRIDRREHRFAIKRRARGLIRKLLVTVPEIAALFVEFPKATILGCKPVLDPKKPELDLDGMGG